MCYYTDKGKRERKSNVAIEYKSTLTKAQMYNDIAYMSERRLHELFSAEYGENFSAEDAPYAVENVHADGKENTLKNAKRYQSEKATSPEAIRNQLTAEYGEQFTQEAADYATKNLPK